MSDAVYSRFANSFLNLMPEFPMSSDEIQSMLRSQGLDSFILHAGSPAKGLSEAAEIIMSAEKGL